MITSLVISGFRKSRTLFFNWPAWTYRQ